MKDPELFPCPAFAESGLKVTENACKSRMKESENCNAYNKAWHGVIRGIDMCNVCEVGKKLKGKKVHCVGGLKEQ